MSLDIALPTPASSSSASGGPPGAGPPTADAVGQAFAALLMQQGPPPAGYASAKSTVTANQPRDDKARTALSDQNTDPDGHDALDSSGLFSVSAQALPANAIVQAALLALSGPSAAPALPPAAAAASTDSKLEAMDTSPVPAPALSGGAAQPSGGELLPKTQPNTASAATVAPASTPLPFALPTPAPSVSAGGLPSALPAIVPAGLNSAAGNAPVSANSAAGSADAFADGAAAHLVQGASAGTGTSLALPESQASALPAAPAAPAAAQSTQTAVQGYAPFAQTALQGAARPANNTSIGGRAPAVLGKAAPEQGASALGISQSLLPVSLEVGHAAASVEQLGQAEQDQADAEKEKPAASGSEAPSEMLMPTSKLGGAAATAPTFPAPQAASNREALISQAAQGMQAMHAQAVQSGHGQMTLQLHPKDWGSLQVSVTMTPNASGTGGTNVTAHLVAGSAEVKQALEAGTPDLKRTLREAGLHLENLTVSVRPAAASGEAQTMGGGRGEGRQPAFYDTPAAPAPGSREHTAGAAAGNGGTLFGGHGMGAQGQSKERRGARPAATNQTEEQTARPIAVSAPSGRLDTRA